MIKQFLRNPENNQPIGILIADLRNDELHFGWSVTHHLDKFNKAKGEKIANGRLASFTPGQDIVVPTVMFEVMERFIDRAQRYFKTETSSFVIDGWVLQAKKPR